METATVEPLLLGSLRHKGACNSETAHIFPGMYMYIQLARYYEIIY